MSPITAKGRGCLLARQLALLPTRLDMPCCPLLPAPQCARPPIFILVFVPLSVRSTLELWPKRNGAQSPLLILGQMPNEASSYVANSRMPLKTDVTLAIQSAASVLGRDHRKCSIRSRGGPLGRGVGAACDGRTTTSRDHSHPDCNCCGRQQKPCV